MIPKDSLDRLVYFQREVNKLFKTVFSNDSHSAAANMERMFPLPLDIYDHEDSAYFDVEVPGVDPKNVFLYVSNDILIVEGVKREKKREGITKFNCMERTFGKFRRLIEIPITANMANINAVLKDGILRVKIAKISDRRGERRQIPIEVNVD